MSKVTTKLDAAVYCEDMLLADSGEELIYSREQCPICDTPLLAVIDTDTSLHYPDGYEGTLKCRSCDWATFRAAHGIFGLLDRFRRDVKPELIHHAKG